MEADPNAAKIRNNIVTDIPEFKVRAAYIDLNKPNQMQDLITNIGKGGFSTVPNAPDGFVDPYVSFLIFLTGLFFNVMWLFGLIYLKSSNPLARIPAILSCVLGVLALIFYATKWMFM
jgi:hypothetical protein